MYNTIQTKVLFVCLGNICRSPTAEGVFSKVVNDANLSEQIKVDSAGTGNWHIGHPPDNRAIKAAALRGIDISGLRARQVSASDMHVFDYIIAMDNQNLADLKQLSIPSHHYKINLFLSYADQYDDSEVPDPYYGGNQGFETALNMIENASEGLLKKIKHDHG